MLDQYSQDVLDLLQALAPDLAACTLEQPDGSLTLAVPTDSPSHSVGISTASSELTIHLDRWHTHMGMAHDEDPEAEVQELLALLADLRSGRQLVTVWSLHGQWSGSGLTPQGRTPVSKPGEQAYTLSWSGVRTMYSSPE